MDLEDVYATAREEYDLPEIGPLRPSHQREVDRFVADVLEVSTLEPSSMGTGEDIMPHYTSVESVNDGREPAYND